MLAQNRTAQLSPRAIVIAIAAFWVVAIDLEYRSMCSDSDGRLTPVFVTLKFDEASCEWPKS